MVCWGGGGYVYVKRGLRQTNKPTLFSESYQLISRQKTHSHRTVSIGYTKEGFQVHF